MSLIDSLIKTDKYKLKFLKKEYICFDNIAKFDDSIQDLIFSLLVDMDNVFFKEKQEFNKIKGIATYKDTQFWFNGKPVIVKQEGTDLQNGSFGSLFSMDYEFDGFYKSGDDKNKLTEIYAISRLLY